MHDASNPVITEIDAEIDARAWARALARYRVPSLRRSLLEIAVTVLPFAGLWATMAATLQMSHGLCLLLTAPAALFLLRLFLIQHDCGHDACFRSRAANDWVGRAIGVLTLTPYDYWKRTHAVHHATVGNLDARGIGDVLTLTVAEYREASRFGRLRYRLYRHPAVMFGLGPAYLFLLQHRLPVGLMRAGWRPWLSTMGTNLGLALVTAVLAWCIGPLPVLMIHGPVVLLSASLGVWLFYVQHQFEDTAWSAGPDWSHAEAALHGSSHYVLPQPLQWLTANIGLHHIHHLGSRIPFYRLPAVLRDHPDLDGVGRVTLPQSLRGVSLVLWDEGSRRLVSFETAKTAKTAKTGA